MKRHLMILNFVVLASFVGCVLLFAQRGKPKGGGQAALTVKFIQIINISDGNATVQVNVTNESESNAGSLIAADIKVSVRANLCAPGTLGDGKITVSSPSSGLVNCTGEGFGSTVTTFGVHEVDTPIFLNVTVPAGDYFFRVSAFAEVKGNTSPTLEAVRTAVIP